MGKALVLVATLLFLSACGTTAVDEGDDTVVESPAPIEAPPPAVIPVAELRERPAWNDAVSFVCHYGHFTEMLGLFDIAIIEPQNVTPAQLTWLRERGTWTVGYISVGEDHFLRTLDGQGPGGYASFYIDDGTGNPRRNENWNSYFVDAGNIHWQNLVIDNARSILNMGFDGIFLDTIDTAEIFPETRAGMAQLIRRLRENFPEAKIVANRGFFMMDDFAPYISGIMFEAFSGGFNFAAREFTVHTGGDLAWTTARADEINALREIYYFPVFALDYADPEDLATIQAFYDRAWAFDFLPSVSVIQLNRVFWRGIEPQTQRGIYSGLTRWAE